MENQAELHTDAWVTLRPRHWPFRQRFIGTNLCRLDGFDSVRRSKHRVSWLVQSSEPAESKLRAAIGIRLGSAQQWQDRDPWWHRALLRERDLEQCSV